MREIKTPHRSSGKEFFMWNDGKTYLFQCANPSRCEPVVFLSRDPTHQLSVSCRKAGKMQMMKESTPKKHWFKIGSRDGEKEFASGFCHPANFFKQSRRIVHVLQDAISNDSLLWKIRQRNVNAIEFQYLLVCSAFLCFANDVRIDVNASGDTFLSKYRLRKEPISTANI